MQCTLVHNENMLDVARLFRTHDPEWLPCTPSELRDNCWIAVMDRGQMLGALTYLDGTSPKKCFITGICTLATHRRQGYARLLLRSGAQGAQHTVHRVQRLDFRFRWPYPINSCAPIRQGTQRARALTRTCSA